MQTFPPIRRQFFLHMFVIGASTLLFSAGTTQSAPVVVDTFETAVIDGREWDTSFPGLKTADAVHRSLLLRFPEAAEALAKGGAIKKAEVVFDYEGFENGPAGYTVRGPTKTALEANAPQWHYVAWALRRPWSAAKGAPVPTFNAWLDNAGYWKKYGAQDEVEDRFPTKFGPVELSEKNPVGRMDITPLLNEEAYGATPGERLRNFAEQGLLIKKWETYDVRYEDWSAYAWAVPTGGHGLTFKNVRLEVEFEGGAAVSLPPARDLASVATTLAADKTGGQPTAVMPTDAEIKAMAEKLKFTQPAWMPDWQWGRVQELRKIGGGSGYADAIESGDPALYAKQIKQILADPPRYWRGWGIQDSLLLWHQYRDALPPYVQDHMRDYWTGWLHPDQTNEELSVDPLGDAKFAWYKEAQDWRGKFSFFRKRWTQGLGTMNFNHTANAGALLGGKIIDSDLAMEDGRTGLENMLLRFWTFNDGNSQEMLDHYYLGVTLSGQKLFTDYGPEPIDRMMGELIRDRGVELLTTSYHPFMRRAYGATGRTHLSNTLGFEQEGLNYILHTLSPKGALFHLEKPLDAKQRDMFLHGYDFPPGRTALQTREQPWAADWATNIVDEKPLPFEITAAETIRGNFKNPPLWARVYLGKTYALSSQDIKGGTADVWAQWNPGEQAATDAEHLSTLTLRYNINKPHMVKTNGGTMPYSGGIATFQHKNKAIVLTKPRSEKESIEKIAGDEGLKSLFSSVALWSFREPPGWTLYVDGKEQSTFPLKLKDTQRITLKDGNTYVGLIPLPATNLGRDEEIVIEPGTPENVGDRYKTTDMTITPVLMVNSYNLRQNTAVPKDSPLWEKINREAHGGFIIEIGDKAEYGSFEAFQKHIAEAKLETRWEPEAFTRHITYHSGEDVMEMCFCTDYAQQDVHFAVAPGQHTKAIPYRRINGENPYLPDGIDRDTTLTQQGTTGRLEKSGAVLELDPGRTGYLVTEPKNGVFAGYNALPDLSTMAFTVPGGVEVKADGKIGMARVVVQPASGKLWVSNAYKKEQLTEPGIANRLLVFGLKAAPEVELNGKPVAKAPEKVEVDGKEAFAIPLEM